MYKIELSGKESSNVELDIKLFAGRELDIDFYTDVASQTVVLSPTTTQWGSNIKMVVLEPSANGPVYKDAEGEMIAVRKLYVKITTESKDLEASILLRTETSEK